MIDAGAPRLAWLCIAGHGVVLVIAVRMHGLGMLSAGRLRIMSGVRHGGGRHGPRHGKRGHSKRQTRDKDGPEPAHETEVCARGLRGQVT